MPPPAHYRVSCTGILGTDLSPAEIFSFGWSMAPDGGLFATRPDLVTAANGIHTAAAVFFTALCTSQARLDNVRVAVVGADGKVLRDATGAFVQGDSINDRSRGGSTTQKKPFQICLVVSLFSAFAGPNGRGRFYVPVPAAVPGDDGRITAAAAADAANRAKTMLLAAEAAFPAGFTAQVAVASGGSLVKAVPPALYQVTEVRVGDVLDTQQRRRRAVLETYTVQAGV
jgi:hypothetical protein